jgi:hypothetical protein
MWNGQSRGTSWGLPSARRTKDLGFEACWQAVGSSDQRCVFRGSGCDVTPVRTNENSTTRREQVVRRTATLMYAGFNRTLTMRRMVPLTSYASRQVGSHGYHGDLPCRGGVPAHGEGLAHLRAAEWATSRNLTKRSMFAFGFGEVR